MQSCQTTVSLLTRTCVAATLAIGFAGAAAAGECPADKVKQNAVTSGETMPVGVTDVVLGSIDLSSKGTAFDGMKLRLRRLVVEPGGVVPWHEHSVRPANIYMISGTIEEYRSTCSVPIVHRPGDVVSEFGKDLAHWWKNTGTEPAVLISADLFADTMNKPDMM